MTTSIPLHIYDATACIIYMEPTLMRLDEFCSANPLRIPRPKIDKLACQAQGVGILATGEITLLDAYCSYSVFALRDLLYHTKNYFASLFYNFFRYFSKNQGKITVCILFPSAGMILSRRSSVLMRRLVVFIHG